MLKLPHVAGGGKQSEDGGDGGASSIDRGARFAAQLTPAQLERMEVVLGAQPEGAASSSGQQQQQGGAPRYVTISTLQTHKHLPLPRELKQQLMAYQVVSLNRQMEELHGDCLALADELAEGGHGGGPLAPGTGKAPGGALGLLRQAAQAAQAPKGEPGSKAASGGG